MSLRIAIIGAGVMGADHARIVAEDLPGAVLQVVCDASAERARKVASAYGAVDAAHDPLETIRRADVDAVLIASPDETHAPLSLACDRSRQACALREAVVAKLRGMPEVIEAEGSRGRRSSSSALCAVSIRPIAR